MEPKGVADDAFVEFVSAHDVITDEPGSARGGNRPGIFDVRQNHHIGGMSIGDEVFGR